MDNIINGWPVPDENMTELLAPSVSEQWMRVLFPARCVLCDTVLPQGAGLLVCDLCRYSLEPNTKGFVSRADWGLISGWYSPFPYAGGIEHAIRQMKYSGLPRHSYTLALLLYFALCHIGDCPTFDYIVPVPMHKDRKRARGYNQAELLAFELSYLLDLPVFSSVIQKCRKTQPQNKLNRKERLTCQEDAFLPFDARSQLLAGNILLLDDVTTTGSTLLACAKALHLVGNKPGSSNPKLQVYAVTVAFA